MIDRKNRYGRTAARIHDADGLARRPSSPTIDIHAHIVIPEAAKLAQPHVDISRIPLAHFADAASKEINAQQEKDIGEVMTTIDRRLRDLDSMGIDIQVVAPAPGQCYYSVDAKIAEAAHRLANDGVVEYCSRRPDRFVGLGVVTLQEPEIAVRELDYIMNDLKLKGVEILTNVDGQELSDPKFRPFFARAEQLGAFIMMHPNGFTHGERLTHFYTGSTDSRTSPRSTPSSASPRRSRSTCHRRASASPACAPPASSPTSSSRSPCTARRRRPARPSTRSCSTRRRRRTRRRRDHRRHVPRRHRTGDPRRAAAAGRGCSRKASCIGCSLPSLGEAFDGGDLAAVAQVAASTVQDLVARPSRWTTQAPHWLVSQPTCVPVRRWGSRG